MIGPENYVGFTVTGDGLIPVNKFKREKTYFLLGIIPIWHISESHDVKELRVLKATDNYNDIARETDED